MKSSLIKSTFREIKGSFGRYLAIIVIIALGVGFFSGLKVTRHSMLETADQYVTESNMYDFRLLSSIGYTDDEINGLTSLDGIEYAEGAFSADAVFKINGTERVFKVHSLTEKINKLSVVAGRLPEKSDECVLDSERYDESCIGKTITTDDKIFSHSEYTVCGIVSSSYYLNIERGNTKLGDGTISAYAYIPYDGFETDLYSEVFLTLEDKAYIMSKEYDELISSIETSVENKNKTVSMERFTLLQNEALSELSDRKQEYSEEIEKFNSVTANTLKAFYDRFDFISSISGELEGKSAAEQIEAFSDIIQEKRSEVLVSITALENIGIKEGKEYNLLSEALLSLDAALQECEEAEKLLSDGESELKNAAEKISQAEKEINEMAEPTVYLFTRDDNIGYSCFESDSKIVDGIAKVFPVFFFLVAALVCTTTMTRMVDEERTQIGTLKALGCGSAAITGKYVFYSGSAALIGCISGFAAGTYLFPLAIWRAYDMLYGFAPIEYVFDGKLAVISFAAAMLCSIGSTLISCRKEFARRPAELVRPKAPKAGKRILLERVTFIWKRLPFLRKVSFRNIFRYKRRLFMMILGIGGCTALVLTGFGIRDSISNIANLQFDNVTVYYYVISFYSNITAEERDLFCKNNMDKLSMCEFVYQGSGDIIDKSNVKTVSVVAAVSDKITDFIKLHDGENIIPAPKIGEAVLDKKTADSLGIAIGDKIVIRDIDFNETEFTVSGICDNYVYNYAFISYDSIAELGYEIRNAYAFAAENMDLHEVSAALMEESGVINVTVNADIKNRVDSMMKSLDSIVWLVIFCASALAFVVLFNLSNINITERSREIATIKVLGFYPSESCAYVFRENLILTAMGAVFGIPLGMWLHGFVINCIKIDMVSFDIVIKPLSYLLAICLTFLFAFIVELVMRRKINGINMAESLKSAE